MVQNYLIKNTDANWSLTTLLLVKHYNDLLDRQSSGRGREEVTYFYVGEVFCIYLGTMYADFQEKISAEHSSNELLYLSRFCDIQIYAVNSKKHTPVYRSYLKFGT